MREGGVSSECQTLGVRNLWPTRQLPALVNECFFWKRVIPICPCIVYVYFHAIKTPLGSYKEPHSLLNYLLSDPLRKSLQTPHTEQKMGRSGPQKKTKGFLFKR